MIAPVARVRLHQCAAFALILPLWFGGYVSAQNATDSNWDNQLFTGTKFASAIERWRYSIEFQSRFDENMRSLDRWLVEGAVTYQASRHVSIVPDLRFSMLPDRAEVRPGFGVLLKILPTKWQIVNQFKVQADFDSDGRASYSFRQVLFFNYLMSRNVIPSLVAGYFVSHKKDFQGLEFVRLMPGVSVRIDDAHSLGVNYFVGAGNKPGGWTWIGGPLIQLVINLRSDWEYRPAKIYSF